MFSHLIGNDEVKDSLRRLLATGRATGSLLFTGEEGVGKKLFALELAKAFNCRHRVGADNRTKDQRLKTKDQILDACDECSSCKRIARSAFAAFGKDDDDKNRLIWSEHMDVAMARPYKNIIRVPVMRELESEANFRPFEGATRVFIIEDADYMNDQAANALLKTHDSLDSDHLKSDGTASHDSLPLPGHSFRADSARANREVSNGQRSNAHRGRETLGAHVAWQSGPRAGCRH